MKVYGLIKDAGDGSSYLRWYTNLDTVHELLEDNEDYYANEGSPAAELTFSDDVDLKAIGISLSD